MDLNFSCRDDAMKALGILRAQGEIDEDEYNCLTLEIDEWDWEGEICECMGIEAG